MPCPLSQAALDIIDQLPMFDRCPYLVPNRETKLPFVTLKRAWQTARKEARLGDLRIHSPTDPQGRSFPRPPQDVLNIVFMNPDKEARRGGFFPDGVQGVVRYARNANHGRTA